MTRLLCALALALAAGCGGGDGGTAPATEVTTANGAVMNDLKEMLQAYARTKKSPPARATDLRGLEPAFPDAVKLLLDGRCEYQWGAGLQAGSTAVLAYPKDAAQNGGAVLLQDGTVKTMTAAEFAAAPKAGKK